jgi:hypothetical protein
MANAILFAYLAVLIHAIHAIRHGAFQRIALMTMCETIEQLDAVCGKFDAHIWRVATFRDPWVIYPPILRGLIARLA